MRLAGFKAFQNLALAFVIMITALIGLGPTRAEAQTICPAFETVDANSVVFLQGIPSAVGSVCVTAVASGAFYDLQPAPVAGLRSFQIFLPGGDRPATDNFVNPVRIHFESPVSPTTAFSCIGASIIVTGQETLLTLLDGRSCDLVARGIGGGVALSYEATLTRIGSGYNMSAGVASGGEFGGAAAGPAPTPPIVVSIGRQSPPTIQTNSDAVSWRVTFDEAVQNVDSTDFVLTGTTANISVTPTAGGAFRIYDVTASGGDLPGLNGTITLTLRSTGAGQDIEDLEGTALVDTIPTTFNANTFIMDNTNPAPVITGPASPTNNDPFTITIDAGETVFGFDASDLTISNGTVTGFFSNGGGLYTATIDATVPGPVTIDIAANRFQDTALNFNNAATQFVIQVNAGNLTPVITGPASPTNNDPFDVTVDFGETVTGFVAADITVGNGSVTGFVDNGVGNFTATIDVTAQGLVTLDIAANAAQDLSANNSSAAVQFAVTLDTDGPTPVITGPASPTANDPFSVTIDFGEPVTGFTMGDITVGNGSLTALVQNSASIFTATIDATSDGLVTVDIAANVAADQAGNDNSAAVQFALTVNTGGPIPVITGPPSPTNSDIFLVSIDFGVTVTGFIASDIVVTNAAVINLTDNNLGRFTATIDAASLGLVTVNVAANAAQDTFGRNSNVAAEFSVVVDTSSPSVTISGVEVTVTAPFRATFTFSEDVIDFVLSDILVGNGTASDFTIVSGSVYTALITPAASGQVTIDVPGGVAVGAAAGNLNTAATQVTTNFIDPSRVIRITQSVIANFLNQRANEITVSDPDRVGRLMRGANNTASPFNFTGNGTLENYQLAFSTGLRQILSARVAGSPAAGQVLGFNQVAPRTEPSTGWDLWLEGKWARVKNETATSEIGIAYIGADYQVNTSLLLGVMLQVDRSSETDTTANTAVEGNGWMAGPYVAAQLFQNLFFDARAAWGQSDNKVNPLGFYTDNFSTERWLVRGQLTGGFGDENWRLTPHVGVIYFEETQLSYTDSLGIFIPGQTISLGRVTFGPKISVNLESATGTVLMPYLGVRGIWDFDRADTVNPASGFDAGSVNLRARAEGGLSIKMPNGWSFSGEGFYDGIGTDTLESYGGKAILTIPLQRGN